MAMKSVAPCCSSQAMIERWYFVSRGSDKTGLFEALYRTRNILAGDAGKGSDRRKAGMGVSRLIHMLSHRNKYPQIVAAEVPDTGGARRNAGELACFFGHGASSAMTLTLSKIR